LQDVAELRPRRAELHDLRARRALAHHGQDFGEAEGADQHRDELESAGEIRIAEGEALVGIHAFLADTCDEQPEKSGNPTLDRIGADDVAGRDDTEQRQPEELEGAEAQRDLTEQRREDREA
jgi:hypothetical protein